MSKHTFFTIEQENWLINNYSLANGYRELTNRFNETFGTTRNIDMIRDKCIRRLGLKGMVNVTRYGNKKKEQLPIGTIRKSQTGTYIKVLNIEDSENSDISGYDQPYWIPLQKKIYQDAHGDILSNQMICFLDGNQNNFELDNLYCIDRKISAIMSRNRWWTDSKEHTLTAIKWCEFYWAMRTEGYI